MSLNHLIIASALLGLLPATAQAQKPLASYAYTTIDPPGSIYTIANGINSLAQIVGFWQDNNQIEHGFLRNG
jgi:hypothetical protein